MQQRVELARGSVLIEVTHEQDKVNIEVSEVDSGKTLWVFPTQVSVLEAVPTGFSYQIASPGASLRMTEADGTVDIRVESTSSGNHRIKLPSEEFREKLSTFSGR